MAVGECFSKQVNGLFNIVCSDSILKHPLAILKLLFGLEVKQSYFGSTCSLVPILVEFALCFLESL